MTKPYLDNLLKRLDEAGSTGADMSPGDPLAKESSKVIVRLADKLAEMDDSALQIIIDDLSNQLGID